MEPQLPRGRPHTMPVPPRIPARPLLLSLILILALILVLPAGLAAQAQGSPDPLSERLGLQAFGQTAPGQGWVLLDGRLFRTEDDSASWGEMTPGTGQATQIDAVTFLDAAHGWAVLSGQGSPSKAYALAHTTDSGSSWNYLVLDLPELDAFPTSVTAVYMGWRDADLGWLVFKFATGSNFSIGMLFLTSDGGRTWAPREVPLGEPAYFLNDQVGWVAGGPAGDRLFRTGDGGRTWESQHIPASVANSATYYSLPKFENGAKGLLPVVTLEGENLSADFYRTENSGLDWALSTRVPLEQDTPQGKLPLSLLGAGDFVLVVPGTARTVHFKGGQSVTRDDPSGSSANIVSLSMSGRESGWGRWFSGDCSSSAVGLACKREVRLLGTRDGGAHWQPLILPVTSQGPLQESFLLADKRLSSARSNLLPGADVDTQPYFGHGFDICQIASLSTMQTWWTRSPYNAVNLYIGGSARACSNSVLSASYLSQLNSQGWRFIPTWVGPQASCSFYSSRMSSNVVTAYNQGIAEADKALNVAVTLGLAGADKSGTVIYYDLEAYDTSNSDCRAAANAFISGWVGRMQAFGNLGAVYGASCGSAPTDWNSIANVPDALWVANWYGNAGSVSFDKTATVWDAYCLSNSLWSNHQRLRQYAGGHDETWGGLSLNIDSNVLDGPVTVPNGTANLAAPSQPALRSPADPTTLGRATDTWLQWKTTGDTCSIHVWGGSIDLTSSTACSQYHLGVRAPGAYSWKVTAQNAAGSTAGPIWHFNVRPYPPAAPSAVAASATKVDVSWTLSADEPSAVDGYLIYADGALAGTVARGVSTFRVTNLTCGSLHSFYVTSVRQGVKSKPTATVSLTTPSCAPVLSSPAEGQVTLSLRPRFIWQAIPDATGYRLQISLYSDFSVLQIDRSVSTTAWTVGTNLPANKIFLWRVRARGPFGDGDWSAPRSFVTANPPGIPVLLSPASDALVRDYTPRLNWSDVSLPEGTLLDHYQVRVSTDAKFLAPTYIEFILLSEFTVPARLLPDTTYYWQARAFNTLGQYSSWSPKSSFRTAVLPPQLSLPENGSSTPSLRPALDWSDVPRAASYTLQLSTSPRFTTIWTSASPLQSMYTLSVDLPRATLVYWRVRTNAANGPSSWSKVSSFKTANPPSTPALVAPVGNLLLPDYTPLLDWSTSTVPAGATFDHYQLQVATNSSFSSKVLDINVGNGNVGASSFRLVSPLQSNTRFFWRVRSFNSASEYSTWSVRAAFRTRVMSPELVSPVDGAILALQPPSFEWAGVTGASGYTIQISLADGFSQLLVGATTMFPTYTPTMSLPSNVPLYWRVRTEATNGPSAWSPTRSFMIVP